MNRSLSLILLAGCALLAGPDRPTAQQPAPLTEAQAAAEGLDTLKILYRKSPERCGFESSEQLSQAELGARIPDFYIRKDELLRYDASTDPRPLMRSSGVTYFVTGAGTVRCQLRVVERPEGWKAVEWGAINRARGLDAALREITHLPGAKPETARFVAVAHRVWLLAVDTSRAAPEDILLISPWHDPAFGLEKMSVEPARTRLVKIAAKFGQGNE